MSNARIHCPASDGYTLILFPEQNFDLLIDNGSENSKMSVQSRIRLNSDFLVMGEVTYLGSMISIEFKQKYDISDWLKRSSLYLGEIVIKNYKNHVVRVGIYARAFSHLNSHLLTVVNPKSCHVKLKDFTSLRVVKSNDCLNCLSTKGSVYYKSNNEDIKLNLKNSYTLRQESVDGYDFKKLPILISCEDSSKNSALYEYHYDFDLNYSDRICCDSYNAGLLKIVHESNEGICVNDTSFIDLMVTVKNNGKASSRDTIVKQLTEFKHDNNVLCNPPSACTVNLFEPDLVFDIEAVEPKFLIPLVNVPESSKIKWRLSYTNFDGIKIDNLSDVNYSNVNLNIDANIQRWRISINPKDIVSTTKHICTINLSCANNGVTFNREIKVFANPRKSRNYLKGKKYRSEAKVQTTYYSQGGTWQCNSYEDKKHIRKKVKIKKLQGELFSGLEVAKISRTKSDLLSKVGNAAKTFFGPTKKPAEITEYVDIVTKNLTTSNDSVLMRAKQQLMVIIDGGKYEEEIKNLWVCNVKQNVTNILHMGTEIINNKGNIQYKFKFSICNYYLPRTNEYKYYLGGVTFQRPNDKIESKMETRRLWVSLSHLSRYDLEYDYDANYNSFSIANNFQRRKNRGLEYSFSDGINLTAWPSNTGLVLEPDKEATISLPGDVEWDVALKQYPVPKEIWEHIEDREGISRRFPWWPEELHPELAKDTFPLSKLSDYQCRVQELLEYYSLHFGSLNVPIGEIHFRTKVLEQERIDEQGNVLKMRQRYCKKLYLFAYFFNDSYEPKISTTGISWKDPKQDSLIYFDNKELTLILGDGHSYTPVAIPPWVKLKKIAFRDNHDKVFSFSINQDYLVKIPENDRNLLTGFISFGNSKDPSKKLNVHVHRKNPNDFNF